MSLDDAQKMELKKLRRVRHEYVKLRYVLVVLLGGIVQEH